MNKETYNGLSTKRSAVECAPLMDTSSNAKIQVQTQNSTQAWELEEENLTPLETSISTSNPFGQ